MTSFPTLRGHSRISRPEQPVTLLNWLFACPPRRLGSIATVRTQSVAFGYAVPAWLSCFDDDLADGATAFEQRVMAFKS